MTMNPTLRALIKRSAAKYREEETDPGNRICSRAAEVAEITRMQDQALIRAKAQLTATAQFARGLSLSRNDSNALRFMLAAVGSRIAAAERQSPLARDRMRGITAEAEALSPDACPQMALGEAARG